MPDIAPANTLPTGLTGGYNIADIMAQAGLPDNPDSSSGSSTISASSGGPNADQIQTLSDMGTNMVNAIKGYQIQAASLQAAQDAQVKGRQQALQTAASGQQAAGTAAGQVAGQLTTGAYEAQQKNQVLANTEGLVPTDANSVLNQAVQTINDSTVREQALNQAAQDATENSKLQNVLFGDTTVSQFFDAHFHNTPEQYAGRAAVQAENVASSAKQIQDLQSIFNGQAEVNNAAATKLTANSAAEQATVAAAQHQLVAAQLSDQAAAAGTANTAATIANLHQQESTTVGEGQVSARIEADKISFQRLTDAQTGKNAPAFVADVKLGGAFLGNTGLANLNPAELKQYAATPQGKQALQLAGSIGASVRGNYTVNGTSAPLPQVFSSPGDAVVAMSPIQGKLPNGMGRTQRLLSLVSANTDYGAVNGVVNMSKPLVGAAKVAAINANANAYYAKYATDIDSTEGYGKPDIKTVAQMKSMTTDPAVAAFDSTVLVPLAKALDTAPADTIVKAAIGSKLPFNTVLAGLVAYGKSARALADSTAQYQVAGLRTAASMPYTAMLSLPGVFFENKKSVDLTNEAQVRDYLLRAQLSINGGGKLSPNLSPLAGGNAPVLPTGGN